MHFNLCPIWNIVSQTDHHVPFVRLVAIWSEELVLSIFDAMYFLKAVIYQAFFDINKCALSLSLFLSCSLSLQWKTGHFSPNTLISLAFLIFDLPEKCQNQSHNKDWKFHYLQLEVHIIILICINIGTCVAQNFIKHILNTFVHCSKLTQLHTEFTENLAKHKHYHMKVKTNSQIIYYRNMVKFLCIYTVKLGLLKKLQNIRVFEISVSEISNFNCTF